MQLYQTKSNELFELIEEPFRLEKEIQTLFEQNLSEFTGLEFVKSEFTIKNNRIDTLAYDAESNAFVIIEYKRERNYSVVDQGVSYLNLMLDYKADFVLEYNESQNKNLKRQDVDWSQSRILFVSPSFTDFQKQSTNFKDLGIELWEIKRYQDGIVSINSLQKAKSAPSIKQIQKVESKEIQKITKEIQQYDEEYHLKNKSDDIKELYELFRDSILNLSSGIEMNIRKNYIAFKYRNSNLVYLHLYKEKIHIDFNPNKVKFIDDSRKLFEFKEGEYFFYKAKNSDNLEYILSLIKQLVK